MGSDAYTPVSIAQLKNAHELTRPSAQRGRRDETPEEDEGRKSASIRSGDVGRGISSSPRTTTRKTLPVPMSMGARAHSATDRLGVTTTRATGARWPSRRVAVYRGHRASPQSGP